MLNHLKQMLKYDQTKQRTRPEKGQSLVEMAIITPLLLILFIGVFEVGWAIRGYLVLSNVNREAVRYAVKSKVLDFSIKNPATVGYDKVLSHTIDSLASQLPLKFTDLDPNTTIIISHIVADTRLPCVKYKSGKPVIPYEFDADHCDCTNGDTRGDLDGDGTPWFGLDDLIAYPSPEYPQYLQTYGISRSTRLSNGDYKAFADQLALENNRLNCTVLKTGSSAEASSNNMIIAESFYDQPQLMGVPFISNRLTDPIPFYAHTAMRIIASRDADTADTVGPTCEVLPITFPDDHFTANQPIDAFEGAGTGSFGWLAWSPVSSVKNSANYVEEELANPRMSMYGYTNAKDSDDHSVSVDDWVATKTGVANSDDVRDLLAAYVGKTVLVPVYDMSEGTGEDVIYHVVHFARIQITQICLPATANGNKCSGENNKEIQATFLYYDDESCSTGGANLPPVAVADSISTVKNTPVVIPILSNDSDPDGNTLTIIATTAPAKGTIQINADNTITYTPKNNDTGIVTFTYRIDDGQGGTATTTVTVTIN